MTDKKTVMGWLDGLTQDDWQKWYSDSEVQGIAKAAFALLKEQDNCENCAIVIEDRQPVVRCKNCKYWRQLYGDKPFYSSIGCCDCNDMWLSLDGETTEVNDIRTDSDFYCGYAVRR